MENKKKLLFVIDSLHAAGAEKSLVTLLSCFDFSKYHVELLLLSKTGEFIPQLPHEVELIDAGEEWTIFGYPLLKSLGLLLAKGHIRPALHRLLFMLESRMNRKGQEGQQKLWRHMSLAITKINGHYDGAIAYLEKYPIYTVIEKVNAAIKIGWIHNDYKSYGLCRDFDYPYLEKLDHIFTISGHCCRVLHETFPELLHKISVMENIVYPPLLGKLAEEPCDIPYGEGFVIVTLARLIHQKGLDMAVEAAKMLKEGGYQFRWYVLGEGPDREGLSKLIGKYGLTDNFYLTGIRSNPYPYIKGCDIYVQPSRFEGKSIALEEVKALCRPVVVTGYPTVKDQFTDRVDCIMCEPDARSIYEGIKEMLDNAGIREEICNTLQNRTKGNTNEINKLYSLI